MSTPSRLERIGTWIEARPDWLKPVLLGPFLLIGFMLARGALVFVPILAIVLLAESEAPVRDLLFGIAMLVSVLALGALSGLVYSLLGKHLKGIPGVGPYAAGVITVFPYMIGLQFLIRASDGEPILAPLDMGDWVISAIMSTVFGSVLGHGMFRDQAVAVDSDQESQNRA